MNARTLLYAFLGGAIVGFGSAVFFAPEKGEDVRRRICRLIRKKGIQITDDEVDALVAELIGEEE